jgi:hypothetical protein
MHGHHESLDSTRPELQRVATAADFTGRGRSNFLASPGLAGAVFSPSSSTSAKDEATRERLVSNRAFGWSGSGSGVDLRDPNGCCTSVTGHSKVEGGGLDPATTSRWRRWRNFPVSGPWHQPIETAAAAPIGTALEQARSTACLTTAPVVSRHAARGTRKATSTLG